LVILITKFVKLLILRSQMPPRRPRKQVLLNIFLGLSGHFHQAPVRDENPSLVARMPIMQAKKLTICSKHSIPTRQQELAFMVSFCPVQIMSTDL
jgi:hypothetical protein